MFYESPSPLQAAITWLFMGDALSPRAVEGQSVILAEQSPTRGWSSDHFILNARDTCSAHGSTFIATCMAPSARRWLTTIGRPGGHELARKAAAGSSVCRNRASLGCRCAWNMRSRTCSGAGASTHTAAVCSALGWSSARAQRFSSPGSCDSNVSLPDGSGPCAGASETLQSLATCPSCGVTPTEKPFSPGGALMPRPVALTYASLSVQRSTKRWRGTLP